MYLLALMLAKIEGKRRRGRQRRRWWDGITDSRDISLSKLRKTVKVHAGQLFSRVYNHGSVLNKTKTLSVMASKWFCEVFSPQNGHVLSIRVGKDISQAVCVCVIYAVMSDSLQSREL